MVDTSKILSRVLSGSNLIPPEPCGLSKQDVDALGERVSAKVGYQPGGDLEEIVQKLGGTIVFQPWAEATEGGSLEVYPAKKSFLMRISPLVGRFRNRFTIAHELGHYFLHSDVGQKPIQALREGSGRVEWEANWFAAGFLMPAKQFREDWDTLKGNVGKLISLYQVSEQVIEIRQQFLGLK